MKTKKNDNVKLAYVVTVGGNSISKEMFLEFINSLKNDPRDKYLIYRNDQSFYGDIIDEYYDVFTKVIEIQDKSIKKIGKIRIISDYISEEIDYVKFLDPDDLINPSANLIVQNKEIDFIFVSMISFITGKKNLYSNFNYPGTNPATIQSLRTLKGFSSLDVRYDGTFNEDLIRFMFSVISIPNDTREKIKFENSSEVFGAYRYHDESWASGYSLRGENNLFRVYLSKMIDDNSIEIIVDDIERNLLFFNKYNIYGIFFVIIDIFMLYYIKFKDMNRLDKMIKYFAKIRDWDYRKDYERIIEGSKKRLEKESLYLSDKSEYLKVANEIDKERMKNASIVFRKNDFFKKFNFEEVE